MHCPALVARAVRNPGLPCCCPCLPRPVLGGLAVPIAAALVWWRLRIMALVFVDRPPDKPTERRIISLRKANTREVNRYAKA